ncbi:hypothetical protein [Micromonospora sp. NPDC049374]|uniref:hypothetical protein n=1 Tax=Micromonospora sp. NPDC049374 TaxID=3154352 RepID=UPI0034367040
MGTRVYAEGPYGALTTAGRTRENALLIAGGIGITPIRALLEDPELTGDVVVLYRARTPADAVLIGELRNLVQARGARLHLLTGRTADGSQPFSPESLRGLVPDIAERDVYLCGPPAKLRGGPQRPAASLPAAVRETEEVVPVNVSTWVLPRGVTVGR